jgi:hypothetical protein
MRLLGAPFYKVHAYLDFYVKKFPPHIHLEFHRKFRHNRKGVAMCKELFGPLGEKAAKIHMIRDVELYVLSKAFSKVMGDEVEHYYERCLAYHYSMDTNTNKYVILEKIEIGKLDL